MSPLRSLSLIALFFVAITLAGCGGGSTPTEEHVSKKGTTSMTVRNDASVGGRLAIGGASFWIPAGDYKTLSNLTVGHSYSWTFTTSRSKRGGSKRISGISSNFLTVW